MSIVAELRKEEAKLNRQITAIRAAIHALDGNRSGSSQNHSGALHQTGRRTMSAAVRARISQKAKARWAKIKAEQNKGKTEQGRSKTAKS